MKEEDCLKRGAWAVCQFKGGTWQERVRWCFGGIVAYYQFIHTLRKKCSNMA